MNIIPGAKNIEITVKQSAVLFSLIVLYQGLFGGLSMKNPPKMITEFADNDVFKFITLIAIAFTASKDVEVAIISALLFVVLINLARTPEERKANGNSFI